MLGKRPPQSNLFAADSQYLKFVGEDSFYGFLAQVRLRRISGRGFYRALLPGQRPGERASLPAGAGAVAADLRQGVG